MEFTRLGEVRSLIPPHVNVLALTATATKETRKAVVKRLKACPHYTSDAHSMRIQSALISSALFTPFYECASDAHWTNPPREVVSIRIEVDPLANCGARRIVM